MCVQSNGRFPLALVQVHRRPPRDRHRSSSTANATGHRHLRAHHPRLRADVWHFRQALGVQRARTDAEYGFLGCGYRADPNNHLFGHLNPGAPTMAAALFSCAVRYGVIYKPFDDGSDRLLRLSLDEAESILPSSEWTVVPGDV
jgi:hypothetical protein